MTDDDLNQMLRAARDDTAPLPPSLTARILADAAQAAEARAPVPRAPAWRRWLGGLVAVPTAAALGLMLGVAQPDAVLSYVPGAETSGSDAVLLDEVFGAAWIEGETG